MPTTNLALKYRPRSFDAVIGQKSVQVVLRQLVIKQDIPSALLFSGSRGSGKTTSARILAAALNCEIQPGPCGECSSCIAVFDGSSLDVIEVDAASHGLVDDIRQLTSQVLYSVGGNCRAVLLDEVHSMSAAGFNALLKTLEEPPPNTVFVLLTTEKEKIPDTILSRCFDFQFNRVSVEDIISRLTFVCDSENLDVEPAMLTMIAERADGGMRDALMALDQYTRVGMRTADALIEHLGESDFAPTLFSAMTANDKGQALGIVQEQMARTGDPKGVSVALSKLLRDLIVLQAGGSISKQGQALEDRKRLSAQVSADRLLSACQLMWEFSVKIKVDNQHAMLDILTVMMTSKLASSTPAPTFTNGNGKMSLSALRSMASTS